MATRDPISEPRTYGNFRRPESPGIGNLGTLGTGIVFGGLVVLIVLMTLRLLLVSLVWTLAVGAVLVLMMVKDQHGRTGLQRVATRVGWRRTRRLGQHLYRSGPLGRAAWGTCQLPGLLASSRLHEFGDSYGRRFAILESPHVGHYSVVLAPVPRKHPPRRHRGKDAHHP